MKRKTPELWILVSLAVLVLVPAALLLRQAKQHRGSGPPAVRLDAVPAAQPAPEERPVKAPGVGSGAVASSRYGADRLPKLSAGPDMASARPGEPVGAVAADARLSSPPPGSAEAASSAAEQQPEPTARERTPRRELSPSRTAGTGGGRVAAAISSLRPGGERQSRMPDALREGLSGDALARAARTPGGAADAEHRLAKAEPIAQAMDRKGERLSMLDEELNLALAERDSGRASPARQAALAQQADSMRQWLGTLADERQALKSQLKDTLGPLAKPAEKTQPTTVPAGVGAGAPSEEAAKAVETAYAQLGKPYVWAAAGPNSFDCSGLTMYSWKKAGVSLPHSARMQESSEPNVARANLAPGDLLFYGNPIHHVTMYIGKGKMIEAPMAGEDVRIASMDRSDYAGASRPRK